MSRRILIDTLEGSGVLECADLAPLSVKYWLHLYRKMVDVGRGQTSPGLFNLQGDIGVGNPHSLFPYFKAGDCDLVLSDGLRIGIFLQSGFGNRVAISVRDANELAERYSKP